MRNNIDYKAELSSILQKNFHVNALLLLNGGSQPEQTGKTACDATR
jgi:hypothetical protein